MKESAEDVMHRTFMVYGIQLPRVQEELLTIARNADLWTMHKDKLEPDKLGQRQRLTETKGA